MGDTAIRSPGEDRKPLLRPSHVRRLERLARDLTSLLDLLYPTNPLAAHLDPWGDERAYLYTARDAVRRVRARLAGTN